ncbi:pyridoxal phosphate-dependent aminotransferase [Clostridium algifaecis]|nr:histidinol-phosphate transaminase [Clostridium algifaecis]
MEHGGDIYTDGILKGKKLLDFSSNINPLGVPKSFIDNIYEAVKLSDVYPDAEYRELKTNIRDYLNADSIEEKNIIVGNGAAEIIDLSIGCFKSICIVVPSFIEYEKNSVKWGLDIKYSFLNENMDFDYKDIIKKLEDSEALIIGNPNNPNGRIIDKKNFKNILDYCERYNKTIIIDEAFVEFTGKTENSFIDELKNYKCLFIVRAITKFFGMPGVRFGYGISKNKLILENIGSRQNPWNINCFAEMAAKYIFKDEEYIKNSLRWISIEREIMLNQLNKIDIIDKTYKTYANFVLCHLKNITCDVLYKKCLDSGLVIRQCDNYRGLSKEYIRLAIKDRDKNNRAIKILQGLKINS